jgi:hypothetical protein
MGNKIYKYLVKRKIQRKMQRKIKKDIKEIRKEYTNDHGIWCLDGIEKQTIEYYKKSTCGEYSDETLLRRIFELKNNFPEMSIINSSIIAAITTSVLAFSNDFYELMDNMNQKINDARSISDSKELIRKINSLKFTSNVKMFLILFFIVVVCGLMVSFINKMFNSVKNTPTIYLNEKEIKIIEDILEGD